MVSILDEHGLVESHSCSGSHGWLIEGCHPVHSLLQLLKSLLLLGVGGRLFVLHTR